MDAPAYLFSWPLLLVSLALVALGLVTWTGANRALVLRAWPSPTMHLAPLYLGVAGLLATLSPLAPAWLATLMLLLALAAFAVGVVAVVWLPALLKPRWLRDAPAWKDRYDVRSR
ncbi:hypothetical protein [Ornithinimicrobium cerasi]|uniref:hypothetical protein n=1 Tax=Ornithinimicrobium cerasi TaxID=2248773 RepID=UPI000EFE3098|nr:hypothetical protein [Ornithinimicrobium cerasi]